MVYTNESIYSLEKKMYHLNHKSIQQIVTDRRIPYLCHFTRKKNFKSIMQYGLCARDVLIRSKLTFENNDDLRLDGYTEFNCLSVGFPNDCLFSTFRKKNRTKKSDWIVLIINPSILYYGRPYFCFTNSAYQCGRYVGYKPSCFEGLFRESCAGLTREEMNLPSFLPTNAQGEVLIQGIIPTSYISQVVVFDPVEELGLDVKNDFFKCSPIYYGSRIGFINTFFRKV